VNTEVRTYLSCTPYGVHAEPLVYGQYSRIFRGGRRVWYRD